jgi:dihydroxyacid dehydratase/phosphogluconate dehydratase
VALRVDVFSSSPRDVRTPRNASGDGGDDRIVMGSEMTSPKFDKNKLPSRYVTEGPARAPHRSYLYAMGLTEKEIAQPFVGVATCWNEAAPCNITLSRQAQAVKLGVKAAGGTPASSPPSP